MSDLFERVTKNAIRFPTNKGMVTVEDLWTMPLLAKSGFDLDTVAKTVNAALRSSEEESFVTTSPANTTDRLRLDVIKHIIAVKQADNEKRRNATAAKQRAKDIAEAIAAKQAGALADMSLEALQKAHEEAQAASRV